MAIASVQPRASLASSRVVSMPTRRDSILDAVRGLCLVLMTINHLPGNRFQRFTYQSLGFVSAFEVFVFLSGLVTVWVYGTVWDRWGLIAFSRRLARGAWRIYAVSMSATLFLVLLTLIGGSRFSAWRPLVIIGHSNVWSLLISVVTFRHTIAWISILRFYCWLLCLIPGILFLLRRGRERLLLALSVTIWGGLQIYVARHGYAESGQMFVSLLQLACWQLLYVLGSILGYRRVVSAPTLVPKCKPLVPIFVAIAAVLFLLRQEFPFAIPGAHAFLARHAWLADKQTLGPLRLLDFVVLLALVALVVQKLGPKIKRLFVYPPLEFLGQHSIYVYVWSMGTTYLGFLFQTQWHALGMPQQSAWILLAVLSLWVPAGLHSWCVKSRQDVDADHQRSPRPVLTIRTLDCDWAEVRTR